MEFLKPVSNALTRRAALKTALKAVDVYCAFLPDEKRREMRAAIKDQHRIVTRREGFRIVR